MTREEAREFALQWLPAWSGNKPKELAAYYSEDAFYSGRTENCRMHWRLFRAIGF